MTDWQFSVPFRFSKFQTSRWLNGELHLLRRGTDFPEEMADEDVAKKLRNAASYRKLRVTLTPHPAGFLIQAHRTQQEGPDEGSVIDQLFVAHEHLEVLEQALKVLHEDTSQRLRALEEEVSLMKEELSLLKTR